MLQSLADAGALGGHARTPRRGCPRPGPRTPRGRSGGSCPRHDRRVGVRPPVAGVGAARGEEILVDPQQRRHRVAPGQALLDAAGALPRPSRGAVPIAGEQGERGGEHTGSFGGTYSALSPALNLVSGRSYATIGRSSAMYSMTLIIVQRSLSALDEISDRADVDDAEPPAAAPRPGTRPTNTT